MDETIRKRLFQDVLAAWEEYRRTGLHLTAAEVDAWLSKLEAGSVAKVPPCHR